MFRCFGRKCQKSPSPKKPNLPANMMRAIAQQSNQPTRRALSRALDPYTRRTLPIGLAVTKTAPLVSVVRPPVVNRSRATAKTPKIKLSRDWIDQTHPQAYKDNRWRYYYPVYRNFVVFLNTPGGNPFKFNKHGKRVNVPLMQLNHLNIRRNWRGFLKQRRPTFHTWSEYQKRLVNSQTNVRLDAKIKRYVRGNRRALNSVSFNQLFRWAQRNRRMAANGPPYVFNSETGHWHRHGANSSTPLNKWNILDNINLTYG